MMSWGPGWRLPIEELGGGPGGMKVNGGCAKVADPSPVNQSMNRLSTIYLYVIISGSIIYGKVNICQKTDTFLSFGSKKKSKF